MFDNNMCIVPKEYKYFFLDTVNTEHDEGGGEGRVEISKKEFTWFVDGSINILIHNPFAKKNHVFKSGDH